MICVVDYETTGLDYYRSDFRITSAAFSWQGGNYDGKSQYSEGEDRIKDVLQQSIDSGYTFVVHNLQFEYGCTYHRFPELVYKMKWVDTMRLVQNYDNGGSKAQGMASSITSVEDELAMLEGRLKTPTSGLGLQSAASRLLPSSLQNHKKEAHDWLETQHGVRKNHGEHLQLLPPDIMERYNVADTVVTLALYNHCITKFEEWDFDWTRDHYLYTHIAKRISIAKSTGIKINRKKLERSIRRLKNQITLISRAFKIELWDDIKTYEGMRYDAWINGCKMKHAKDKRIKNTVEGSIYWDKNVRFNINSGKQKRELFVELMGYTPKFFTKTDQPSFASAHMQHYGKGGKIIGKKKKRELVLKQCENLYILSEADGRFHHDLRACGTATGRNSGGRHE